MMKLRLIALAVCLSGFMQASSSGSRPAWGAGGKAKIPSLAELNRTTPTQRRQVRPTTPKTARSSIKDEESTLPQSIVKPVISGEGSPVIASGAASPVSIDSSASDIQTSGNVSSLATPRTRTLYNVEDVKGIVKAALQIRDDQYKKAREVKQSKSNVERRKLTAEESIQLAQERKAALKERDRHVFAEQHGLQVEDSQQTLRRRARDFVDLLDTIPDAARRDSMKQDFLRTMFLNSKSLPEHTILSNAIDQIEKHSTLLRNHAQHFMDYLNTLPDASARDVAIETQFEKMRSQNPEDAEKFLMFLEQQQPKLSREQAEPAGQQPTQDEQFELEMASDAQDIQDESKRHFELLSRQEESIKAQTKKLKKYQDQLTVVGEDEKARIEALITKTQRELAEMKTAFDQAVEKSASKLEQHMQDHTEAVTNYVQSLKEAELAVSTRAVEQQAAHDKAAELVRQSQEREQKLLAQEKELQDQKDLLQKSSDEHARQLQAQRDELQRVKEEHARQLKEKEDVLGHQAQELAAQKSEMERSASRSPSDLSGSMTRRSGMLSRSTWPAPHFAYQLPVPKGSAVEDEDPDDIPLDISRQPKPKTWTEALRDVATKTTQKARETFSWIKRSLPKASDESYLQSSSNDDSSSSDDGRSSSDDRVAQEAREEVSYVAEERQRDEQEKQEENDDRRDVDFSGEMFWHK